MIIASSVPFHNKGLSAGFRASFSIDSFNLFRAQVPCLKAIQKSHSSVIVASKDILPSSDALVVSTSNNHEFTGSTPGISTVLKWFMSETVSSQPRR